MILQLSNNIVKAVNFISYNNQTLDNHIGKTFTPLN